MAGVGCEAIKGMRGEAAGAERAVVYINEERRRELNEAMHAGADERGEACGS